MVYPKLCQSTTSFAERTCDTTNVTSSVGMVSGFCTSTASGLCVTMFRGTENQDVVPSVYPIVSSGGSRAVCTRIRDCRRGLPRGSAPGDRQPRTAFRHQIRCGLICSWFWCTDDHLLPCTGKERVHCSNNTQRRIPVPSRTSQVTCDARGWIVDFIIEEGKGDMKQQILEVVEKWLPELPA